MGDIAYASAKGGVIALTRHLAMMLAPRHIRVNAIAPGKIASGERYITKFKSLSQEKQKEMMDTTPLGRHGLPEEVANAVIFLASEESSYITGVTIDVNGGNYIF